MIKHKHHIVPKHAGGTDDSSNIIELTIEEHAEAHKILYEKYDRIEDKLAWLGLSGQIGKDEILKTISMAQKGKKKPDGFGKKISKFRKNFRYSDESKLKMSLAKKGKKLSKEHKDKIGLSQKGKKQPESQKQKVKEILQCQWTVTSPNGISSTIINLNEFCRKNLLDQGNMIKVSKGIIKKHKGWTCSKDT
jgi:hypothetical protein